MHSRFSSGYSVEESSFTFKVQLKLSKTNLKYTVLLNLRFFYEMHRSERLFGFFLVGLTGVVNMHIYNCVYAQKIHKNSTTYM